tara:strand:+ start:371 stop:559 length:189 start_codon:yes stop_codon:yes gene_type:complete
MITKNKKYDNCEVYVDHKHTNAHGQPALKCKDTGKWIQWVSKKDLPHLQTIMTILRMEQHEI